MNPIKSIVEAAALSRRAQRVSIAVDGSPELTVLSEVDSLRVVYGRDAKRLLTFELDAPLAKNLAFALLRWWVAQTWCGLRSALLARAQRKAFKLANRAPRELRGGAKA